MMLVKWFFRCFFILMLAPFCLAICALWHLGRLICLLVSALFSPICDFVFTLFEGLGWVNKKRSAFWEWVWRDETQDKSVANKFK